MYRYIIGLPNMTGMKRLSIIFLGAYIAAGNVAAQVAIEAIEPTVLFPAGEPLRQLAWMKVENRFTVQIDCHVKITFSGMEPVIQSLELPPGSSSQKVLIPDIRSEAELTAEIVDAGGRSIASRRQVWTPQRHWKIFVVHSSHEDLGYENFIFRKQKEIADYIDIAHHLSGSASSPSSYHYTLETLLFMRNYIEERSESAWRELVESDLKTGRMDLMGSPSGVHTQWMDYEELARSAYGARREMKDRYGLDLKTFMIVDNPSASWSACQALSDAGFKYIARWGQGWRTGGNNTYATTKLPALFWWIAPDAKNKLLYAWRSHYNLAFWYGQDFWSNSEAPAAAAQELSRKLIDIENGKTLGPYPYDALIDPEYGDHEVPHFKPQYLLAWNQAYRYPEIQIGQVTQYFEYVEKKYGGQLPVLSGELNNFSGDYSTIDPDSQGWKRRAARLLPLADGFAAIAGAFDPGFLNPAQLIDRTWRRLFDYDEHSWPTQPVANDFHMFNAQWVKQREGERALTNARKALNIGFDALKREISNAGGRKLVVFNPLAHERTDLVEADLNGSSVRGMRGESSPDGRLTFLATNIPAFGYRVFDIAPAAGEEAPASDLKVGQDSLENSFYRIQFDAGTGAIRSLFDKELNTELVDGHAAQQFNQMVYLHTKSRESAEGDLYCPKGAILQPGKAGPLHAGFTTAINDPVTGAAITQTVTLWSRIKRIDIVNHIEHAKALFSTRYEDRYRDNIFYAFPIDVPNGQPRAEYAGGVVRPYEDQLRWGSHDYLNVNRWADVSNDDFGVTMAPREASAVSFGEIRYNRFSIDYRPSKPYLFSFAWSNRMAGLLTLEPADCNATLHYSFTSHAGGWNRDTAARFGWEVASPLEAAVITGPQTGPLPRGHASFVAVSAPNVQLITLKDSEQPGRGWILRLVETEGRDTDINIEFANLSLSGARECDLVENDRRPIPLEGGRLRLHIGKYAYSTIRLIGRGEAPAAPQMASAHADADSEISLTWPAVPGAAAYNIYRSDDPMDPPTAYTLVRRVTPNRMVDTSLNPDTTYYYYIAAVNRVNLQSSVSPQVSARTTVSHRTPPAPVTDLGIVRRSKDTLIVYWHKAVEPDVAHYLVYRSTTGEFPGSTKPVAIVNATNYFLQVYRDTDLQPGRTYYYKILAEDWAGNRQVRSPVAKSTTASGAAQ